MVWHLTAWIPIVYILFFLLIRRLFAITRERYAAQEDGEKSGYLRLLMNTITRTVPGWLFLCALVMITSGVVDNIDRLYFHIGLEISKYGFLFFIFIISIIQSQKFMNFAREVEKLNIALEEQVEELEEANVAISHSEEKYRLLVEGTKIYIFTMDLNGNILTANRAS
jgi:PAS domain-containing protein